MTWSAIRSGGFFPKVETEQWCAYTLIQQAEESNCWRNDNPELLFDQVGYAEFDGEVGFNDFDDGTIHSRAAILDHF